MNPTVNASAIPEQLKQMDKWLVWDTSEERKRPFTFDTDPTALYGAKKHTADDWLTFEEALQAAETSETVGVGVVFDEDDPFVGIDLDGCNDGDGGPEDWLPSLKDFRDSAYIERSPSGEGLHLWIRDTEIPDWWSNIEADDEHKGVEVYDKWFFTVTGDEIDLSTHDISPVDDLEPFLQECHKSLKGEDPLADGNLNDYGGGEGGSYSGEEYDGEEWLDGDDVADALNHISPDVSYNKWRDIGFALVDFFDDRTTARKIFLNWSRGGSKWDSAAENYAETIIENAKAEAGAGDVTIATLIDMAKSGGWEVPSPKSTDAPEKEANGVTSWEYVRSLFEDSDVDDKRARRYAAIALKDRHDYIYVDTDDRLLKYHEEDGLFEPGGKRHAKKVLARELGFEFSTHDRNEILATVQDLSAVDVTTLNAEEFDRKLICLKNGVLDLETRELLDHDPKYQFTQSVPVEYDPDATAPNVEDFLGEISLKQDHQQTLVEMIGATLHPEYLKSKFLFLFGEGQNGKGVYFELINRFLGPENVEGRGLHELANNRFAKADLHGKLANIGGDIDDRKLKNVGTIKRLTSNTDPITAERKFGQPFKFVNRATLFFAANEPPAIDDMKRSMGRRLVPIHMPNEFVENPDPDDPTQKQAVDKEDLLEKMTTEEELSGLLNLALDGMDRLRDTGDVSLEMTPMERLEFYQRFSDPIYRFATECLEKEPGATVEKADVYEVYKSFSRAEGHGVRHNNVFWREFRRVFHFEETQPRNEDGEKGPRKLMDARFTGAFEQYAPERLKEKYDSDGVDEASEKEEEEPALEDLEPGRHTIEATLAEKLEPKPYLQGEGTLADEGMLLDYVARGDTDPLADVDVGDRVRITDAKVTTNADGLTHLEITGLCDVEVLPTADDDQTSVADAATDGGDTSERDGTPRQRVVETVRAASEAVGVAYIIQHTEGRGETLREAIRTAKRKGDIEEVRDDEYTA